MIKNYLKITFRNIRRQKGYSFINILGLAIGIMCCVLMLLWVNEELSYDRFHENFRELHRVIMKRQEGNQIGEFSQAPYPVGPTLKKDYPEVVEFCRYTGGYTGWNLRYEGESFHNERIAFADPSFFKMFNFPFVKGNPETALQERFSIIITEELAAKCFGEENPVGKVMQMSERDLKVTGVVQNVPNNSHMQFDYIVPIINQTEWREQDFESWEYYTGAYLLLQKGCSVEELNQKIEGIIAKHSPKSTFKIFLQPMKKVHLYSDFQYDSNNVGKGNITYVYIFSITAIGILLLACINFMNLSTARSGKRAKEIGMRKVTGAQRKEIINQFFGESVLLSFIAFLMALLLSWILLPTLNTIAGKQLTLNFSENLWLIFELIGITLITGFLSGIYPALFLSSYQPVKVLRGSMLVSKSGRSPLRKALVIVQFVLTIILVIGTVVIYSQLNFMRTKDLGFDQNNIVSFAGYGRYWNNYESARGELLKNQDIINVTNGFPPERTGEGLSDFTWEGKQPGDDIMLYPIAIGFDYIETFDMKIVEGRSFSRDFASDSLNCIINQTAARVMGLESPVGKRFSYTGDRGPMYGFTNREGMIIGVVKDFHVSSLHSEIKPMVLKYSTRGFFVNVRMNAEKVPETIDFLEKKWKEFVPGRPFDYRFLGETIDSFYTGEQRIATILRYFTILALFISCLGILGLSSFTAEQRTKEIGIRKVLGASVPGIVVLLSKEFTKWVLFANIIAWPVAYYFMKQWLENFAYRINLGLGIFLISAVTTLLIALITVSFQAVKSARANPVNTLKYE